MGWRERARGDVMWVQARRSDPVKEGTAAEPRRNHGGEQGPDRRPTNAAALLGARHSPPRAAATTARSKKHGHR
jgi:hypothetical protein